jgi:hypothetical protein
MKLRNNNKIRGEVLFPVGFPNVTQVPGAVPGTQTAGGVVLSTSVGSHITTNTTTTFPSPAATIRLRQIVINITGAPSAWVVTIQDKGATPKVIFKQTFNAASTAPIVVNLGDGVTMSGGVDIITSGTTPGVADVFLNY